MANYVLFIKGEDEADSYKEEVLFDTKDKAEKFFIGKKNPKDNTQTMDKKFVEDNLYAVDANGKLLDFDRPYEEKKP